MGRKALHTQEQVFEAADRLAAGGFDVTPASLREALGGGSLTTIYKHYEAWTASRAARPAPVIIEMPESVKQAFAQCWQAAATEAGKEIGAIREKADAEIKLIRRRLDEAIASIAQLEVEQEAEGARTETLERQLTDERAVSQAAATEAAAREAGLSATADQLVDQLATLKDELRRAHDDAGLHRAERDRATSLLDQLRDETAVRLREQAEKDQHAARESEKVNVRLVETLAKAAEATLAAERLNTELAAQKTELADARREARDASGGLAKALGELDALRTQVASQSDIIKGFAPSRPPKSE